MRSAAIRVVCLVVALLSVLIQGQAQERGGRGRSARRAQGGPAGRRGSRQKHETDRDPAQAGRLLRSEGAGRARRRRRNAIRTCRRSIPTRRPIRGTRTC